MDGSPALQKDSAKVCSRPRWMLIGQSPWLFWILTIARHSPASFCESMGQEPWHQQSEMVRPHSRVGEAGAVTAMMRGCQRIQFWVSVWRILPSWHLSVSTWELLADQRSMWGSPGHSSNGHRGQSCGLQSSLFKHCLSWDSWNRPHQRRKMPNTPSCSLRTAESLTMWTLLVFWEEWGLSFILTRLSVKR